jgi:dihydrodipicolinate synthase/N-acetylneuraminate lyase
MSLDLRGIIPACVVTFDADGRFDEAAYRRDLRWLLRQGPVALRAALAAAGLLRAGVA